MFSFEQGKVMNCGGGGSCGTCIVEVFYFVDLLCRVFLSSKDGLKSIL